MTLKWILHLVISLSSLIISAADVPKAENVHWMSLDFKTVLVWSVTPSNYLYTVRYSQKDADFEETPDCIRMSESECDLSQHLKPLNRSYIADIQTEPEDPEYDYILEELPHTNSLPFNPYRESNISAVAFSVKRVDKTRVLVNITDPLSGIHVQGKHLTIRDILKKDLKYKISYYKAGSTGKKDVIADFSEHEVPNLDPGQSYCFMVAAYIPSRPMSSRQGALSGQLCTHEDSGELKPVTWIFIVLAVVALIIIVAVTIYCKCCRQTNQNFQTAQSSAPI